AAAMARAANQHQVSLRKNDSAMSRRRALRTCRLRVSTAVHLLSNCDGGLPRSATLSIIAVLRVARATASGLLASSTLLETDPRPEAGATGNTGIQSISLWK